jgi:hypothetical protein
MCRAAASAQPSGRRVSACSASSHAPRAAAQPAASWRPLPRSAVTTRAPASSATASVSSVEPPSATTTSFTSPSTAAGTSAASVAGRRAAAFSVGITTEIMRGLWGGIAGRSICS